MKFINIHNVESFNSGIYAIKNIINGKIYIGSTNNFNLRFSAHLSMLKNDDHDNIHLQRSFNKHGESNFIFEAIESVEDINLLVEREQYWIDLLNIKDKNIGYNICLVAGSTLNKKHTDATKKKISLVLTGRKLSSEHVEKMRVISTGRKHTDETKRKISKLKKGQKYKTTEKSITASNNNLKKGRINNNSEESIEKRRQKLVGRHYHTKESRRRAAETKEKNKHNSKIFKLNEAKVKEIKIMLANKTKQREIANRFNISLTTVSRISQGIQWGHIIID